MLLVFLLAIIIQSAIVKANPSAKNFPSPTDRKYSNMSDL